MTDRDRRERKKALFEKAIKNGALESTAKIVSAIYILQTESALLYDELDEILNDYGIKLGRIITLSKRIDKAFDDYFKEFNKMIPIDQQKEVINDHEQFDKMFRKWSKL